MKKNTFFKVLGLFAFVLVTSFLLPEIYHHFFDVEGVTAFTAAAPLVTVFTKEIEEKLYPESEFYHNAKDDSVWISGNKVSRGVAGASPGASTNPALPLSATQRVDDSNEYAIQLHVTDPQILTRDEELIVNYNKRQSIIDDHVNVLNTRTADNMAYQWAPSNANYMIRTTGAGVAAVDGSQTGLRKAIEKQQFIEALIALMRQDAKGPKFGVCPATLYGQLLALPDFVDYTKTGRADILKTGVIGEILGIKMFVRSYTTLYTNAGTPVKKPVATAGAVDDNLSILIWDATMCYKALGKVNVNIENRPATYLGDIINADVRSGGKSRADGKGVISIIQTPTA